MVLKTNRHDSITDLNDLKGLFGLKKSKAGCWVISLPSGTSAASMASTASMTSVASMTSTASFHKKNLLSMMLPLTWQQNDLFWSLNVEWIVKHPLFYGFLALFQDWGCGGQGYYFQPNPSVISQISASKECTDTIFMT